MLFRSAPLRRRPEQEGEDLLGEGEMRQEAFVGVVGVGDHFPVARDENPVVALSLGRQAEEVVELRQAVDGAPSQDSGSREVEPKDCYSVCKFKGLDGKHKKCLAGGLLFRIRGNL